MNHLCTTLYKHDIHKLFDDDNVGVWRFCTRNLHTFSGNRDIFPGKRVDAALDILWIPAHMFGCVVINNYDYNDIHHKVLIVSPLIFRLTRLPCVKSYYSVEVAADMKKNSLARRTHSLKMFEKKNSLRRKVYVADFSLRHSRKKIEINECLKRHLWLCAFRVWWCW